MWQLVPGCYTIVCRYILDAIKVDFIVNMCAGIRVHDGKYFLTANVQINEMCALLQYRLFLGLAVL